MKKRAKHLKVSIFTWNARCNIPIYLDESNSTNLIEETTCKKCIRLYKSDIEKEHRGFK